MMDEINQSVYKDLRVVDLYKHPNFLQIPEQVILDKIEKEVRGKPILDIGVGAGRTVSHLTKLSSTYTGIDYSKPMIEACKKKYPQANLINLDARDLSTFLDKSFFCVLFSFNGIDYLDHSDRIKIFTEIYRVLQNGGYFIFSSHNRASYNKSNTFQPFSDFEFTLNVVKLSYRLLRFFLKSVMRTYNRLKYKKFENHNQEYSIINDCAHNYSLLTYYISLSEQLVQLNCTGFETIEAYDRNGQTILTDSSDTWIYYLARKSKLW